MTGRGITRRMSLALLALAGAALAIPRRLLAAWPESAFGSESAAGALEALVPGALPREDARIHLTAPQLAENGALVPIDVSTDIPGVTRIALIVDRNPNPLAATFDFTPAAIPAVSIRLKMRESSRVMAVVEAEGEVYTSARDVKVAISGCA
jgi:sulfur-oxidizing protein SoxY